jgi:hemoglobin/transferrin/lactoferrin receptor protein
VPSGYDEWSLNAKAKFRLSEQISLTISHQQLTQTDVPLYHRIQLENFAIAQFDLQQHQLQYARLLIARPKRFVKEWILTASHQQSKEMRTNRRNNAVTQRNEFDRVNTAAFILQANSQIRRGWAASSGIELYRDRVGSKATETNTQQNMVLQKRGLYPDASLYGNHAVFTLHHFTWNRWSLDAGMRLNSFSIRLADTSLGTVHVTPFAFVYNAAVNYALNKQHTLYANYSTGYRAPNIDDMGTLGLVDFRYEVPATQLSAEKSINRELGYKFRMKKLRGDFSLYHMRLRDLITRLKSEGEMINGYAVYRKENSEKAIIKGVETSLSWQPVAGWHLDANLTYNYGQNLSRDEALRRIPPLHGRLSASYKNKKIFYSTEWLYAAKQTRLAQGDKDDIRIPTGGTPGWNVLNMYAGYQLKQIQINTGLQNIFNVDYRTHGSGINGVGRSVWVSMAINW